LLAHWIKDSASWVPIGLPQEGQVMGRDSQQAHTPPKALLSNTSKQQSKQSGDAAHALFACYHEPLGRSKSYQNVYQ